MTTLPDLTALAEAWAHDAAHLQEVVEAPGTQELVEQWKREFRAEQRATYEITHPRRAEIMRGLTS